MSVSLVVAMTPDRVIGRDGRLPWRMPADLRRLCEYAERAGQPVSGYHDLRPAGDALGAWFRGDAAAANQFAAFGAGHNGSILAFWLYAGPDAAPRPASGWAPGMDPPLEVALVHRPRYDDWSLPKGKLEPGESVPAAAVREIAEETGHRARLGARLGEVSYQVPDGAKVVHYWAAEALDGRFVPPGPSGSPTRGLVNVLPTGRNFYSVDPKAIPSRNAWDVGVALADSLLARHLADTGAYPRSVKNFNASSRWPARPGPRRSPGARSRDRG